MSGLWVLILLGVLLWLWQGHLRARDLARTMATRLCREHGGLVLDQALVLERVRLRRDPRGRLRLERQFGFACNAGDDRRHPGSVVVLGDRVELVYLADEGMPR